MPLAPEILELLEDLATALSRRRWYVFGAQAASVYGRPRLSADVDVTVALGDEDSSRLVADLAEAGFALRVADEGGFLARTRVLPFVHAETGIPLDVVLAGPGFEEQFLQRAQSVDVLGTHVPFISPEDLIVTKLLAGRGKDFDDVVGVLREKASVLDLSHVRSLLGQIEEALARGDLLPELDRALMAAQRRG